MAYVEFRLTVPIHDLVDETLSDRSEICAVCDVLTITRLGQSLDEQYQQFYDYGSSRYFGDPSARIGRGDVRVFLSDLDEGVFFAINFFDDATDQMNTVEVGVRCSQADATRIAPLLRTIRETAEVSSALLEGNLGLSEELDPKMYPRKVSSAGKDYWQHVDVYLGGRLCATSRKA